MMQCDKLTDKQWQVHAVIKAKGWVLMFTHTALTWYDEGIASQVSKQSTSVLICCINWLCLLWEGRSQDTLFYSIKISVVFRLTFCWIKNNNNPTMTTSNPIATVKSAHDFHRARDLLSDHQLNRPLHILVCICLRAPSTGLEWAVQVMFLQSGPGCARTGNLSSEKMCLGRTRQVLICAVRQNSHNYN